MKKNVELKNAVTRSQIAKRATVAAEKYAAKVVRTTASGLATESIPVVVTVVE